MMDIENKRNLRSDMSSFMAGQDVLDGLRKPKLHRRPNRPKSAHFKIISSRPKSAKGGEGRISRAKQDVVQNGGTFLNNGKIDKDKTEIESRLSVDRPLSARPKSRMSHRYEEVLIADDDDLNTDPVEYFNRPVSRLEGNIHHESDNQNFQENDIVATNFLRDDEEYYMNMDPVEYFENPNIRDIIAITQPEEKVTNYTNHASNKSEIKRNTSGADSNVSTNISKHIPHAQVVNGSRLKLNNLQNTKADDVFSLKRNLENNVVSYQSKEQNSVGVKHDKLLKNRTNLRATNQFNGTYGNVQNNKQYHGKLNGFSGILKSRPTSLIEQTDTSFNSIRFAPGSYAGNKCRDRFNGESVILQKTNKSRPFSEDPKLILPDKTLYELNSNPAERVLARYTKGLSIEERKATRSKFNKDTMGTFQKVPNRHGFGSSERTGPHPRKLKPIAINFENVTF